jgi:PAS domain-containing protein
MTLQQELSQGNSPYSRVAPEEGPAPASNHLGSETRLFIIASVWIFIAEFSIMLLLGAAGSAGPAMAWGAALVDALGLALVGVPIMYLLLFRPLVFHISEHRRAQGELSAVYRELEQRVEARTAQLAEANRKLREEAKERLEAAERLNYSETKYSTVVENSLTGIFILRGGKFTFVNRQFVDMLGYILNPSLICC